MEYDLEKKKTESLNHHVVHLKLIYYTSTIVKKKKKKKTLSNLILFCLGNLGRCEEHTQVLQHQRDTFHCSQVQPTLLVAKQSVYKENKSLLRHCLLWLLLITWTFMVLCWSHHYSDSLAAHPQCPRDTSARTSQPRGRE